MLDRKASPVSRRGRRPSYRTDLRRAAAASLDACGMCRAGAGQPCTSPSGQVVKPHLRRQAVARSGLPLIERPVTRADRVREFPRGCRVQVSELGRARCISRLAPLGVVVGHSYRYDAILVRRDSRRVPVLSFCGYWERVDPEKTSGESVR